MMKKILFLLILLITACTNVQTEYPLTEDDIVVVPNPSAFGGPIEVPIKDLSTLLVDKIDKAQQDNIKKQQKMLEQLVDSSKKIQTGIGEITLFFDKGSSSLEFNYIEHDRLIRFLDHVAQLSQGRKVLFVCIGSSSGNKDDANNIELSVLRAKEPVYYIKKYLVNIPFEVVATYGIGSTQATSNTKEETHTENEIKYQNVRIVASFEKDKLPLLPE